jgi:hypothetical protein
MQLFGTMLDFVPSGGILFGLVTGGYWCVPPAKTVKTVFSHYCSEASAILKIQLYREISWRIFLVTNN